MTSTPYPGDADVDPEDTPTPAPETREAATDNPDEQPDDAGDGDTAQSE